MDSSAPKEKPDPYSMLDAIHKIVEELRAELADTKSALANLEESINKHHSEIRGLK